MWEVYGKLTWTVTDWLAIGAYVYYTPNWLGSWRQRHLRRRQREAHGTVRLVPDRLGRVPLG